MTGKIILTMLAFAANSVLCRVALTGGHIDPATFSDVRIVSGALFLVILMSVRKKPASKIHYDWRSGLALTLYVLAMSWSYLRIDTGTGALLLFGTVQTAMVIYGWRQGEKIGVLKGAGLLLAVAGTLLLLLPGLGVLLGEREKHAGSHTGDDREFYPRRTFHRHSLALAVRGKVYQCTRTVISHDVRGTGIRRGLRAVVYAAAEDESHDRKYGTA